MNELALIFDRMGIRTLDVLEAAGTKWNFLPFRPGLVGGHCIGVDPYYLTHKAEMLGYHPQVILAGRRINDSMASVVADAPGVSECHRHEVTALVVAREVGALAEGFMRLLTDQALRTRMGAAARARVRWNCRA